MGTCDLVVLTPDLDWERGLNSVFHRPDALGTRAFSFEIVRDPMHDSSVARNAAATLRPFVRHADYALVCVDHEGAGRPNQTPDQLAQHITLSLDEAGWVGRSAVIVVAPEIERWVWCDPRHLPDAIGWPGDRPDLFDYLDAAGMQSLPHERPKEALETLLRSMRKPWSSALFAKLGKTMSITRCTDPAFRAMIQHLRKWFPPDPDMAIGGTERPD